MNPYEPPRTMDDAAPATAGRTPFVIASIGAYAASLYGAVLMLFLIHAALRGATSPFQIPLPLFLVVVFAAHGGRVWRGDQRSAHALLGLHLICGLVGVAQTVFAGSNTIVVFDLVKVAIHVFGAITAHFAFRVGSARAAG